MTETTARRSGIGPPKLAAVAAGVACLSLVLSGCGSDPADPETERVERVSTRLEASFSQRQVDCIIDALDEDTIIALDREAQLPPDSAEMFVYSAALKVCVIGPTEESDAEVESGET